MNKRGQGFQFSWIFVIFAGMIILLFFMMFAGGIAEVVSIGVIIPFLSVMISPGQLESSIYFLWIKDIFNLNIDGNFYWKITLLFSIIIIFSGFIRFFLAYITAKFNFGMGAEIGSAIYNKALHKSFEDHIRVNSSEIVGGLNKLEHLIWIIFGFLNTISAFVLLFFIIVTLLIIDPFLSSFILFGLGGMYILFLLLSKNTLNNNSKSISNLTNKRVQIVYEGLGSMRDILLHHNQKVFINHFNTVDGNIRKAQTSNNIISPTPRFVVESLSIILIAVFSYQYISEGNDLINIIPILGALALGLQKLVPLAQQAYLGWSQFSGNKMLLYDIANLLSVESNDANQNKIAKMPFNKSIRFKDVSFNYKDSKQYVLKDVSFKIKKGSIVGFIGPTGSGKSTIIDLIMCLLDPSSGEICIDGIALDKKNYFSWQKNISHVPQDVYLLDSTFAENIAFGLSNDTLDIDRVKWAADKAQISNFIELKPEGYFSLVGECGSAMSGGQKQRIGIARALYHKANVIIFDEATSALDEKVEKKIISSIVELNRGTTIIMISHKMNTLTSCDYIYKVDCGTVTTNINTKTP